MNKIESQQEIKNSITAFCDEIAVDQSKDFLNSPAIMIIYIGSYAYERLNASLDEAFTSSFVMKPKLYHMIIDGPLQSQNMIDHFLKDLSDVPSNHEIRLAFVSMMDDPYFDENCLTVVDEIKTALDKLEQRFDLNLYFKSFYGIFDMMTDENIEYQYAFRFIERGKHIWNNIYHLEKSYRDQDLSKYAQTIALNMFKDDDMKQDIKDDYRWKSLSLHSLKVPEFVTCRVLKELYTRANNGKIDQSWEQNINESLDAVFKETLSLKDNDAYQYVPLIYQKPVEEKRGFFPRKPVKKVYDQVLLTPQVMEQLVEQLYVPINLTNEDYENLIEKIICSSTSIDPHVKHISDQMINTLEKRIINKQNEYDQMKKKKTNDRFINDIDHYLKEQYHDHKSLIKIKKEIEIIQKIIEYVKNTKFLKEMTDQIREKNSQYVKSLDDLTKYEYGGTLEDFDIHTIPPVKVNQSIQEILDGLDKDFMSRLMSVDDIHFKGRLDLFLSHMVKDMNDQHNLGKPTAKHPQLENVEGCLLLSPTLFENQDIVEGLRNKNHVTKVHHDLYRDNTFYAISSRAYDSMWYITKYRRGDQ